MSINDYLLRQVLDDAAKAASNSHETPKYYPQGVNWWPIDSPGYPSISDCLRFLIDSAKTFEPEAQMNLAVQISKAATDIAVMATQPWCAGEAHASSY